MEEEKRRRRSWPGRERQTRSCLPERLVEHHVKYLPTRPPPSKPVIGPFLGWDTYPEHSLLVPRLFIWLRGEEHHLRKGLLD